MKIKCSTSSRSNRISSINSSRSILKLCSINNVWLTSAFSWSYGLQTLLIIALPHNGIEFRRLNNFGVVFVLWISFSIWFAKSAGYVFIWSAFVVGRGSDFAESCVSYLVLGAQAPTSLRQRLNVTLTTSFWKGSLPSLKSWSAIKWQKHPLALWCICNGIW